MMHTYQLVTTFKERLTELCYESRQTDSELAKALGISKQTLSAWKCGTRSPKGPTIETIARHFNVPVDWLMGFDVPRNFEAYEKEKPVPEDELDNILADLLEKIPTKLSEAILKLSPQGIDRLLEYAEFLLERESSGSSAK